MPIPDPTPKKKPVAKKPTVKPAPKAPAKPRAVAKPTVSKPPSVKPKPPYVPPKKRIHVGGVHISVFREEQKLGDEEIEALKLALRSWFHDVDARDKGGLGSSPDIVESTRLSIGFYQKWRHLNVSHGFDSSTQNHILPPPPTFAEQRSHAMEVEISKAVREVGYNNGVTVRKYLQAVGLPGGFAWCAALETWIEAAIGAALPPNFNRAYVPSWIEAARAGRNGMKVVSAAQAYRGCWVCFDWNGDGVKDHIGMLLKKPRRALGYVYMTTGEGNTGPASGSGADGVYRKTRVIQESRLTFIAR